MPKVVSRSVISADNPNEVHHNLHTYHCLCGQMLLISDKELTDLPQRRIDRSRFLHTSHRKCKLIVMESDMIRVQRSDGLEKQTRYKCKKCGLPVAYQVDKGSPRYFLLHGGYLKPGEKPDLYAEDIKASVPLAAAAAAAAASATAAPVPRFQSQSQGKFGSTSIATATEQEEEELDLQESGKAYEADAQTIHRTLAKQGALSKRTAAETQEEKPKKKGTLFMD